MSKALFYDKMCLINSRFADRRRGGRDGGYSARGDRSNDRERGSESGAGWSRAERDGKPMTNNDYNRRENESGDAGPWRRSADSRAFGSREAPLDNLNSGRDRSKDFDSTTRERPETFKLKLEPRSVGPTTLSCDQISSNSVSSNNSIDRKNVTEIDPSTLPPAPPAAPKDKWDLVFASKDPASGDVGARSRGFGRTEGGDGYSSREKGRSGLDRGGGFGDRDRGAGFGDRDRGGGYGDKGGRGGGFGDRGDRGAGFGDRDRSGGFGDRGGGFVDRAGKMGGGGYGDRGDRRTGGEDRSYGGRQLNRKLEEEIDDPRFAGKFGSAGRTASDSGPKVGPSQGSTPVPSAVSTSVDKTAADEKAARKAAKAEAERKRKEEAELQAARAAEEKEKAKADAILATAAAESAYSSGLQGEELATFVKDMNPKPSGAALLKIILSKLTVSDPLCTWSRGDAYGAALQQLLADDSKAQMMALYEVQRYCQQNAFPKISVKSGKRGLIEVMFQILYEKDIIDERGFVEWADDDNVSSLGKTDALVQTCSFMQWLREEEEEEGAEEEEEEEIDEVRQTV